MLLPRSFVARSSRIALVAAALVACGGDEEDADTSPDVSVDEGLGDTSPDAADGAPEDTRPDGNDVSPDTQPDEGVDVPPDEGIDTRHDEGADVQPDERAEIGPDETTDDTETTADEGVDTDASSDDTSSVDTTAETLAVTGEYDDNFGGFTRVEASQISFSWYGPAIIEITQFSNDDMFIVGQNTADDMFNPGLWSRIDWRDTDEGIRWCQTRYDAATEVEAVEAAPANDADFATGCGGFSWSLLTPGQGPLAITGTWVDPFGTTHTIGGRDVWTMGFSPESSATFDYAEYSNRDSVLFAQNGADNDFNPGAWSRIDWLRRDGRTWFCQTAYDATTLEDARATAAADPTDPLTSGCGGFSWSELLTPEARP